MNNNVDVEKYDMSKFLVPYWRGKISYAEAAFVREDENGYICPVTLLYPIGRIVSVRSADLKKLYREGADYIVENGKLKILRSGNIPVLRYADFYHAHYEDEGLKTQFPAADNSGGGYIVAEMSHTSKGMSAWCLACTYVHDEISLISPPRDKSDMFPVLNANLKEKKSFKTVFYGDSITFGWSATALEQINLPPYCPSYCNMAMDFLESKFDVKIPRANLSVSGKMTPWAKQPENLEKVIAEKPDFVILAFGMNDGAEISTENFCANTDEIVRTLRKNLKNMEIAVVLPMLPNDKVGYKPGTTLRKNHLANAAQMKKVERAWIDGGIPAAVVDVTGIHHSMLKYKTFQDFASSNTNHPNDYTHRLYAQILLKTIIGENYYE